MVVNPRSTAMKEIILSIKQLLTFRVIFYTSVLISRQKIKVVTKGVRQPSCVDLCPCYEEVIKPKLVYNALTRPKIMPKHVFAVT